MVNLKKYPVLFQHFVLFLTFAILISCSSQKFYVTKIEGEKIVIDSSNVQIPEIENYINPYRKKIDTDLNTVLALATQNIDKSGQWQSNIGNLLADITLQRGNLVFTTREKKSIDVCLLNYGGIRSIIGKGYVTSRNAFEIMPFENSLVVIGLKAEQINEIANYIIKEKKPHPLSGMTFYIDKNTSKAKNIMIQGKPLKNDSVYYVATSDYLSNGGDNMNFFKKGIENYNLDYKLRNILIDYLKEADTIPIVNDVRIFIE